MLPEIHYMDFAAKQRQDDVLREAERDHLAALVRATMPRPRRVSLRRRSEGRATPSLTPSRTLTREPAV